MKVLNKLLMNDKICRDLLYETCKYEFGNSQLFDFDN